MSWFFGGMKYLLQLKHMFTLEGQLYQEKFMLSHIYVKLNILERGLSLKKLQVDPKIHSSPSLICREEGGSGLSRWL